MELRFGTLLITAAMACLRPSPWPRRRPRHRSRAAWCYWPSAAWPWRPAAGGNEPTTNPRTPESQIARRPRDTDQRGGWHGLMPGRASPRRLTSSQAAVRRHQTGAARGVRNTDASFPTGIANSGDCRFEKDGPGTRTNGPRTLSTEALTCPCQESARKRGSCDQRQIPGRKIAERVSRVGA